MKAIPSKRYRHYKGKEYTVIDIARNKLDPKEWLVVYRAEYDSTEFGDRCVWAQRQENFEDQLQVEGHLVERFTQIN